MRTKGKTAEIGIMLDIDADELLGVIRLRPGDMEDKLALDRAMAVLAAAVGDAPRLCGPCLTHPLDAEVEGRCAFKLIDPTPSEAAACERIRQEETLVGLFEVGLSAARGVLASMGYRCYALGRPWHSARKDTTFRERLERLDATFQGEPGGDDDGPF